MLVAIEHFRLSRLWIFHWNSNDLIRERAALPRLSRKLLRPQRELINALPRQPVTLGKIFRCLTHGEIHVRIAQCFPQGISEWRGLSKLNSPPKPTPGMRKPRH